MVGCGEFKKGKRLCVLLGFGQLELLLNHRVYLYGGSFICGLFMWKYDGETDFLLKGGATAQVHYAANISQLWKILGGCKQECSSFCWSIFWENILNYCVTHLMDNSGTVSITFFWQHERLMFYFGCAQNTNSSNNFRKNLEHIINTLFWGAAYQEHLEYTSPSSTTNFTLGLWYEFKFLHKCFHTYGFLRTSGC